MANRSGFDSITTLRAQNERTNLLFRRDSLPTCYPSNLVKRIVIAEQRLATVLVTKSDGRTTESASRISPLDFLHFSPRSSAGKICLHDWGNSPSAGIRLRFYSMRIRIVIVINNLYF